MQYCEEWVLWANPLFYRMKDNVFQTWSNWLDINVHLLSSNGMYPLGIFALYLAATLF